MLKTMLAKEVVLRLRNSRACLAVALVIAAAIQPVAKVQSRLSPDVQPYVQHDAPRIVLAHVRVIDGTGRPPVEDRNVVLEGGRIAAIEPGADVAPTSGTIEQAHARGLKVTGHLCSVTYPEAVELGIDDLEHGFFANTQGAPGKQPDVCPAGQTSAFLDQVDPASEEARALIENLLSHHVAVTSTLPVFEHSVPNRPPLNSSALEVLTPAARAAFLYARSSRAAVSPEVAAKALTRFQRGMALERAFARAGGLLIAGPDPTGNGGTIPGFANHREVELLVEAGFTPAEAIQVATLNGARYLGRDKTIGSVEVGKHADLFVVMGDPSKKINDIEQVRLVFRDGVGYDREKLLTSIRGRYGEY